VNCEHPRSISNDDPTGVGWLCLDCGATFDELTSFWLDPFGFAAETIGAWSA
jgi:hypothetical protein